MSQSNRQEEQKIDTTARQHEGSSKKWEKDYDASDMEVLFRRGDWNSWKDAINWLQKNGDRDNELTPGEVEHMVYDLQRLEKDNVPFTHDYRKAYEEAKGDRSGARTRH